MVMTFEGVDCLWAQIIRAKCKESVSLESPNHVETCGTHRWKQDNGNVQLL